MKKKDSKVVDFRKRNEFADLPDLADLYTMAYKTLAELPDKYKPYTQNLIVRIENYASSDILENLDLTDKNDLLGLYRGVPLPLKIMPNSSKLPDIIHLYRCPLIKYATDNMQPISELVEQVMIHEIGHHFGYSKDDSEWLDTIDEKDGGRNRD